MPISNVIVVSGSRNQAARRKRNGENAVKKEREAGALYGESCHRNNNNYSIDKDIVIDPNNKREESSCERNKRGVGEILKLARAFSW